MFKPAAVGFDPVVGVLLDVMPAARSSSSRTRGYTGAASVITSDGLTFNVASARPKNRRPAWTCLRFDARMSMTCPYWSNARYT
jgi:hypothetical protein